MLVPGEKESADLVGVTIHDRGVLELLATRSRPAFLRFQFGSEYVGMCMMITSLFTAHVLCKGIKALLRCFNVDFSLFEIP